MTVAADDKHVGIPIIDFAPLLSDDAQPDQYAQAGNEVYQAFKNAGFAYIKNHGVPQEIVDEAFEWGGDGQKSRKFFALPQSEKDKVPHPPEGWYHRGYSGVGREKVSQNVFDAEGIARERSVPDCKESFEMGGEHEERLRNIMPAEHVLPGFRAFFALFFDACYRLELRLLRAIAVGMGLDADYFVDYHRDRSNQIRLLHYPPIEEELLAKGKVDCIGAHTDFGTVTMLFQDEVGGLEVETVEGKGGFTPAPYIPGTVVVNIGDFLMRWSNDELRSTLHHVRTPPVDERDVEPGRPRMTRERYSIPYFVGADGHRTIDCVPGCWGPDRPKKYEPINASEYMDMRLNATY
ncbi:oxoglutarate/iron-dependent oxygenase [Purpureocillium lilacinum]|uniref:Oxoglutarate/iron-dependent oxygenase n=1 Tax=Purpureocillium lilacinum TaxID=33203 RepID=A0A179GHM7_PURLI|nr:oxoglutarate/iron-dependent oxygenase [Purpureocillium lilacinum]